MEHLSPAELAAWLANAGREQDELSDAPQHPEKRRAPVLLDVREPWEFETCHIPGSQAMPMASVPARQEELDPEQAVVCICHHGARSMQVAAFLERAGFSKVYNLTGGVHGWALQVDPSMPTY